MIKPSVWIIQNDINKFKLALSSINKNSANNFLYTNCISNFSCDEVNMISKNFNIVLYSESNNTFIMFIKGGILDLDNIKNYLDNNEINYHEITFKNENEDIVNRYPHSLSNYEKSFKEFWVASDENDLKSALKDTLQTTNKNTCTFYPLISSNLTLEYSDNSDKRFEIDDIKFQGIITTIDKIILLVELKMGNDLIYFPLDKLFDELGFKNKTIFFNRPRFINQELKFQQQLDEKHIKTKKLILRGLF